MLRYTFLYLLIPLLWWYVRREKRRHFHCMRWSSSVEGYDRERRLGCGGHSEFDLLSKQYVIRYLPITLDDAIHHARVHI